MCGRCAGREDCATPRRANRLAFRPVLPLVTHPLARTGRCSPFSRAPRYLPVAGAGTAGQLAAGWRGGRGCWRQGAAWLLHAPGPASRGLSCCKLRARRALGVHACCCLLSGCSLTACRSAPARGLDGNSRSSSTCTASMRPTPPALPCALPPLHAGRAHGMQRASSLPERHALRVSVLGCRERLRVEGICGKTECRTPVPARVAPEASSERLRAPAAAAAPYAELLISISIPLGVPRERLVQVRLPILSNLGVRFM